MMNVRRWFAPGLLLLFLVLFISARPAVQAQGQGTVYSVEVEGIVTSMTVSYVQRALHLAEASNANVLIIYLSSEGAVLRDVRPLAATLFAAQVPVVVYVAPTGTASGAGGSFLLSAAHIAAMAPDTSFGNPYPLARVDQVLTEQTTNLVLNSVSDQLRSWNSQRNRNTAWVDRAVREGVVMTSEQAFATTPPTIDVVASDRMELLTLLEGRTVQLGSGQQVVIKTLGRAVVPITPTLWEQVMLLITNPTMMFLLLVMGGVAVYAELVHPGVGIFAGISVVLLLGALVGLVVLPIRAVSLLGMILAFVVIAVDLFVPSHGALTLVGVVLMIISAFTLIDTTQAPGVFITLWVVLVVALAIAAFAAVAIWMIIQLRERPVTTGQEGLVGRRARVERRLAPEGMVFVDGALWQATCEHGEIEVGEWVRVCQVHDLRLVVERGESTTGIEPQA